MNAPHHSRINQVSQALEKTISAHYPLVYLYTPEESRVIKLLETCAHNHDVDVIEWSCTDGFQVFTDKPLLDPVKAVQSISDSDLNGFYVFKDLDNFLSEPTLIRALRDAYHRLRDNPLKKIVVISSQLNIPAALQHCLYVMDVPPPDSSELQALVEQLVKQHVPSGIPTDVMREIVLSLTGLTLDDSYHLLSHLLSSGKLSRAQLLQEIRASKKNLTAGAECLEFVTSDNDLNAIAGFANFKKWMNDRADLFNQSAVDQGVPLPRGILIMGISGCGKSLCAKAIPKLWNVPLFRLDMNLVFSGADGNPQHSFHKALKTIEAMAPVVLWIDEIENGLGTNDLSKPAQSQIFSAFLTWMQEKPPLVFVVATANRIEYLPAEMIRKGRFDQVFFVDLPNDTEREEMIELYLERNGFYAASFNMRRLVSETKDWNGAEIAQVIESARIHCRSQNRDMTTEDIVEHALNVVPLAHTMSEQIKAIKDWAWDRAIPASAENPMMIDFGI